MRQAVGQSAPPKSRIARWNRAVHHRHWYGFPV